MRAADRLVRGRGLARALVAVVFGMAAVLAGAAQALAATSAIGYDVSYPQCKTLPSPFASFFVVGVNGGLANDSNPCLLQQLTWASAAPGLQRPMLPGLSLYLDAADPGNGVPDWPSPAAGTASAGTPYGFCDGSWSRACAFSYGMQKAVYSYGLVVAVAPAVAGAQSSAATAPWWIDVETEASWAVRSSSREWAQLNVAALRGYVAGLRASGARGPVGLYSDAYQWRAITGLGARSSRARFPAAEHDWVTGSTTLAQARRACAKPFSGSAVTIAQFTEGAYDRDYACPAAPASPPHIRPRRG
jgi:hypothetical protein